MDSNIYYIPKKIVNQINSDRHCGLNHVPKVKILPFQNVVIFKDIHAYKLVSNITNFRKVMQNNIFSPTIYWLEYIN